MEKEKLTNLERERLRYKRLQEEMIDSKKKIEEAKNKEILKIWNRIKFFFLEEEILNQIKDPVFVEAITLDIKKIVRSYITPKEMKKIGEKIERKELPKEEIENG